MTLMDCERLFSSEIGLAMSGIAATECWWLVVLVFLGLVGDPAGELVKTEPSDWFEAALSREEHEQLFPSM